MKMNLIEAEKAIIEEFSMYEEWLDKYEYLIELGKSLDAYPESAKTDDKLIKGCQSRVWLDHKVEGGKIIFTADSDAIITKGIISLLIGLYDVSACCGRVRRHDYLRAHCVRHEPTQQSLLNQGGNTHMKKFFNNLKQKALAAKTSVNTFVQDVKGDLATNTIGAIIVAVVIIGILVLAVNTFFPGFFTDMR